MKFRVKVTQSFKVYRHTFVEIEAGTREDAVSMAGDMELPSADAPCWIEDDWNLENEEVEIA